MNLDHLIKSLESAQNDNKKFALLLILSELFKSNKLDDSFKTDENLNTRLFEGIDPHFLARLITTKQQVDDSPIHYKQVGLSILTQFLDFPELITNPVLLTKINSIFEIIKSDIQDCELLKFDAYKYVYRLSEICPEFLYQNGLIAIIFNDILLNEKIQSQQLRIMYDFDLEGEKNFEIVACKILSNMIKDMQDKENKEDYPLDETNRKVQKEFKNFINMAVSNQTEFKFKLLNYINFFLSNDSIKNYILTNSDLNDLFVDQVLVILNDLFKSKVKNIIQEQGFLLLNNYVLVYDFEPLYMKDRNFFYLLIHLLCIQISLNLQKCYETNEFNIDQALTNKMSVYYSLLEEVIKILSTASPFDTDDSDEDVSEHGHKETEPELEKVIKIIVEALETISLFIKDTLANDFSQMNDHCLLLLASSTRVLLCWMTHESLLEDEIMELIPKMIEFSEFLACKSFELDISNFITAGLNRLLNDKNNILEFKSSNPKNKNDLVKLESESMETKEQIELIQSMIDHCSLKK